MARPSALKRFREWDEKAKPGSSFPYYTSTVARRSADVFDFARGLSDRGDTLLLQRRESDKSLTYLTVRISPRAVRLLERLSA